MPTIISHPAVALLRRAFGDLRAPVVVAGALLSILPDGDCAGFYYDIPYGSTFGHRGFTHSILFAVLTASIAAALLRGGWRAFAFLFLCAISHPLLDAFTNGGRGVALLSPFSNHRFFAPWRPIQVSPIGAISAKVLMSELKWVWLPCVAAATALRIAAAGRSRGQGGAGS